MLRRRQEHDQRYLQQTLAGLRSTGYRRFRLVGTPAGRLTCAACAALEGVVFPVEAPPAFPAPGCTCPGGSRLVAVAVWAPPLP